MKVSVFIVNPFAENCYILWQEKGSDAMIVDPGMADSGERNAVDKFIAENELKIKAVLLTHQHADHILSAQYIAEKYDVDISANFADNMLGNRLREQVAMFGLRCNSEPLVATRSLEEGESLALCGENIKVLNVPGHSPGGLAFYLPDSGCAFVGDSLFAHSIGRTDLPGGDYSTLINSVAEKLLTLPDETVVYSGHGESTTIGDERRYNPYFALNYK